MCHLPAPTKVCVSHTHLNLNGSGAGAWAISRALVSPHSHTSGLHCCLSLQPCCKQKLWDLVQSTFSKVKTKSSD